MCLSMLLRAEAWHAILVAALPGVRVRRRDTARAEMIGVLMSATLPARLGEPSRALIVARRARPRARATSRRARHADLADAAQPGRARGPRHRHVRDRRPLPRRRGRARVRDGRAGRRDRPAARRCPRCCAAASRRATCACSRAGRRARAAMVQVRAGLAVFRQPRLGAWATTSQLTAWAVQWLACYVLLVALGLDHQAGIGAAAAVLFAVNVTAALPVTPSNLGVFQAACVAVLVGLRRQPHRRARLRDHPAGRRDRDRGRDRHARAARRGDDVEGPAPAGAARRPGRASPRRPQGRARPPPSSSSRPRGPRARRRLRRRRRAHEAPRPVAPRPASTLDRQVPGR